ncbi:MAG TPA: glyoxalase [Ignavibacteria bacterium]|nr:glyoxalase [Ignavibacteria bacterium]
MKIKIKKLHHIQICIPKGKEDEARKFYSEILSLNEIEKPDALKPNGGLWYQSGDIQLHIGVEDEIINSKRHPAFEVEELNSVKEYLISKNTEIKEEIPVPGINRFSFRDPFGNRIEFLEKTK